MVAKKILRKKKRVVPKSFGLTGYSDIDEFLKTCFETPVEDNDDLLRNLKAVVSTIGTKNVVYVLRHLILRLFQYDDFYNLLMDDVETNIIQFESMRKMNVIGDEPEVQRAHKNILVMHARLDEFAKQMEELSGQKLRKKTTPLQPINVTKETEKFTNG